MPQFFFNIRNGHGFTADEEGRELATEQEARTEAEKGVRSLVAEEARLGRIDLCGSIEVTDAAGTLLFVLPFEQAFEIVRAGTGRRD